VLALVLGLLLLLAGVAGWWIVSYPTAVADDVGGVRADPAVTLVEGDGLLSIHPSTGPGDEAIVFYQGAAVPLEAYLPTWAPIVAETGISAHLVGFPLRLAVLRPGRARQVVAAHPEVARWWIGGHSLGGTMASSHLAGRDPGAYHGLVLFGSYPAGGGLADRDELTVLSVVGDRDGLSTVQDIEDRRHLLPDDARVVVLEGVNHAQFGRYGAQRGDRPAAVDDAAATRAIVDAVVAVLEERP
jgi:predicted alpha/beta-hydrolase family hydrolase